ncbi:MAG TPA: hypothetical protein PLD25_24265 [Chloroflexota bacterium]|nr:hypothetical protein [Chloroflexota bacterium]HUM68863.1 hypothetical protein [Chloroflexota bacterium]
MIGYTLTGLAVLGVLLLLINPTLLPSLELSRWTRRIPLIVAVILAGLLPLLLIPGLWYETRLRNYMPIGVPAMQGSLSPVALRALLIWVILALLLPFVVYVIPPVLRAILVDDEPTLVARIDALSQRVNEMDGSAPVNNAFAGLIAVLNSQLWTSQQTQIDQMIYDLQLISNANPHNNSMLIQSAISQLQVLHETTNSAYRAEIISNIRERLQLAITIASNQVQPSEPLEQQCRDQWQAAYEDQSVVVDPACYNFLVITLLTDLGQMENLQMPIRTRAGVLAEVRQLATDPSLLPVPRAQIESNIAALENRLPVPPTLLLLNWSYLVFWFTAVSLTSLFCTICASSAMEKRIGWLDPHVPQPIFCDLNLMTNVVEWELTKREFVGKPQWLQIERNSIGGLDLVGLIGVDSSPGESDNSSTTEIHKTKYQIVSDMWANITAIKALTSDTSMSFQTGQETDIVFDNSVNEIHNSEQVARQKEVEIARYVVRTYFSEGELQELCLDLQLEYEDLAGNSRIAKARELVLLMYRHNRGTELMNKLRELRPGLEIW